MAVLNARREALARELAAQTRSLASASRLVWRSRPWRAKSILARIHHETVGAVAEAAMGLRVDRVADVVDRAVAEGKRAAGRMNAAEDELTAMAGGGLL